MARTQVDRGLHVGLALQRQDLRPRQPRELGQVGDADGHNGAVQPRAEDSDEDQGDQHLREGPGQIDHRRDSTVEQPAEVTRGGAQAHAQGDRAANGGECHRQRGACAVNDARQHVAAELVSAQPVGQRRVFVGG